jgi:antitoxin component YwqK of YwqJK toxin-antitoxin module
MRTVVAVLVASATNVLASPLACPPGTHARGLQGNSLIQEWCERSDGTRHGPYRSFDGNARAAEGQYVDGQQDGPWLSWHTNGTPFEQASYTRGLNDGPWIVFGTTGRVEVQGGYRLGKQHGRWSWWYASGAKKGVVTFLNGREQGHSSEWNEDGSLISDGYYNAGLRVGAWIEGGARGRYCAGQRCGAWKFVANSGAVTAGEYQGGLRSGVWKQWTDGKLVGRSTYRNGKKNGRSIRWDLDTGVKVSEIECRNGIPHGARDEWRSDGGPRLVGSYVEGKRDGKWTLTDDAGRVTHATFKRGEYVSGDDAVDPDDASVDPDDVVDSDGRSGLDECKPDELDGLSEYDATD